MNSKKYILIASILSFLSFYMSIVIDSWFDIYQFNEYEDWLGKDATFQSIIFAFLLISPLYVGISFFGFKCSRGFNKITQCWLGIISGMFNAGLFIVIGNVDPRLDRFIIDTRIIMAAAIFITSYAMPYIFNFYRLQALFKRDQQNANNDKHIR